MDMFVEVAPGNETTEPFIGRPSQAEVDHHGARDYEEEAAKAAENTLRDATIKKKRVWKVPERVPKHMNIPIALMSATTEATKGEFRRLGMDCVINGVWLAYYGAKANYHWKSRFCNMS